MNTQALKGKMVENGYTQKEVAKELGIAPKTLSLKLKKGVFGTDEVSVLIRILNIDDPMAIFFDDFVTPKVTYKTQKEENEVKVI